MERTAGLQPRRARDYPVPEHLLQYYADLMEKWASVIRSEAGNLQDRPQSSLWKAISRFLSGWWRTAMLSRDEEILLRACIMGHAVRRSLQREWSEMTMENLESYWRAYQEEVSGLRIDLHGRSMLLEAPVEEEHAESLARWPEYASEDLDQLVKNAKELEDSVGDASQMLFHAKEMETLLGRVEEKARATGRKYEARLAASLRDVCRVHDPKELSQEQSECVKGCVTALVEGWGKITRDKLNFVRTRLLDKGLTWLPVTDKAMADLEGTKSQSEV